MLAKYSDHPGLLKAVFQIAEHYIASGNDDAAEVLIDNLIADFNDHPDLPDVLYQVANQYQGSQRHEQAIELYQYILDTWPDSDYVMQSRGGMIMADIGLGNDANAQAALDSLIADFNDHPALPEVVFVVGEQYYNDGFRYEKESLDAKAKGHFTKAAAVWERIITQLPESDPATTAQAYCFSGHCYRKLGEYEKSTAYYQYVVADYPEHRTAWQALFRIAHNYEDMKDLGIISETDAGPVIKATYRQLLEKYPDCKMARVAQRWLIRHNSK